MMSLQIMTSQGAVTSQGRPPGSGCGWCMAVWVGGAPSAGNSPNSQELGVAELDKAIFETPPYLYPPHS